MTWEVAYGAALADWFAQSPNATVDDAFALRDWFGSWREDGPPAAEAQVRGAYYFVTTSPMGHEVVFYVDEAKRLIAVTRIR